MCGISEFFVHRPQQKKGQLAIFMLVRRDACPGRVVNQACPELFGLGHDGLHGTAGFKCDPLVWRMIYIPVHDNIHSAH